MDEILPRAKLQRLDSLEEMIQKSFQRQLADLETTYRCLAQDIADQKFIIQQKLFQNYIQQINTITHAKKQLFDTKFCNQSPSIARNAHIPVKMDQTNMNVHSLSQTRKSDDCDVLRLQCQLQLSSRSDSADINIPIAIKKEEDDASSDYNHDDTNVKVTHSNDSQLQTVFDVNKTEERMKFKIQSHFTKMKKKKNDHKYKCHDNVNMY